MRPTLRTEPDHKAMMLNPDRWPQWPFLPVKNYRRDIPGYPWDGMPNCGLMVFFDNVPPTVFMTSLYDMKPGWTDGPQLKYASIDELLAQGWIVD